jgi:hypothetical protein
MTTENFCFVCKTDKSKPVKQEVNGTVILPPLVFPGRGIQLKYACGIYQQKKGEKVKREKNEN